MTEAGGFQPVNGSFSFVPLLPILHEYSSHFVYTESIYFIASYNYRLILDNINLYISQ